MDMVDRISRRIMAENVRETLESLVPPEIFHILLRYDLKTQGQVLVALQMQDKFTIRLLSSRSGGDPARSGYENGWILAINEPIKPENQSDPGGSSLIRSPHKWNEFFGNHIELAQFEKKWFALD